MPASVTLRRDYSAEELRRLAKSAQTISQGRRLLSLAAVMDGMSRADAARIGGMDRQTLRDWVHRLMKRPTAFGQLVERAGAASVGGAASRTGGDRRSWPRQRGRRRRALAALRSQARHQGALRVDYHERHVGTLLKRLGFSHISARPRHPGRTPRSSRLIKKLRADAERPSRRCRERRSDRNLVSR